MSKRTKAEWKAKQQWRADLDARHADHERRQTVKNLMADLPINSRVAVSVVDNPHGARGEKNTVLRSTRDDPLGDMLSRRVIDVALFNAGRKWQRLHELTQIGPISAIDPAKEAVDGGKMRDPITDKQIDAFRELAGAERVLGEKGTIFIRHLLAKNMTVGEICRHYGLQTRRQTDFVLIRIRECLEDLGKLWGFVGKERRAG